MKLCDYGCGQKARFQFKNGKWCCNKHYSLCPSQRKKNSTRLKKIWEDSSSGFNSTSCKEKQSKRMEKEWKDLDSIYNSNLCKEKISNTMKELHKDPTSIFNTELYKINKSNGLKKAHKDPNNTFNSILFREKRRIIMEELWNDPDSKFNSILWKEKHQLTIEKINKKYSFFSKIEEMRYNPVQLKEIQVRCKNHECKNSKEKGGWFTPTYIQLYERIRQLENKEAIEGSYFYCSQYCKDICPLYNLRSDPYKNNTKPYTLAELDTFNKLVLKRDNEICYYCREHHATIVHHLRPQKLEPFFALDPDYAISVCMKCHYKYGHPTGSKYSTGNLAKIVCSVESQKFLNQKL
jgi:hypothetical protein